MIGGAYLRSSDSQKRECAGIDFPFLEKPRRHASLPVGGLSPQPFPGPGIGATETNLGPQPCLKGLPDPALRPPSRHGWQRTHPRDQVNSDNQPTAQQLLTKIERALALCPDRGIDKEVAVCAM